MAKGCTLWELGLLGWQKAGRRGGLGHVPALAPSPSGCPSPSLQQSYQFPDDVGISIGTPLDPQWIRLEIHYSNFHNLPGEHGEHSWEKSRAAARCLQELGRCHRMRADSSHSHSAPAFRGLVPMV